jgi:hypothetical protein
MRQNASRIFPRPKPSRQSGHAKPQAAEQFKKIGGSLANFLNMPFYRNMLRIGAGPLGFSLLALFQYGSVH